MITAINAIQYIRGAFIADTKRGGASELIQNCLKAKEKGLHSTFNSIVFIARFCKILLFSSIITNTIRSSHMFMPVFTLLFKIICIE